MTITPNDITYDRAFYIRELQTYLRTIQRTRTGTTNVPIDGIFGSNTTRAVREFQYAARLPVTGEVDRATWESIREAYLEILYANALPLPIQAYRDPAQFLQPGDQGDGVAFLQIMLRRIGIRHPNIPAEQVVTGLYTTDTAEAVRAIQRLTGLPVSGLTDKVTWDAITNLYNQG